MSTRFSSSFSMPGMSLDISGITPKLPNTQVRYLDVWIMVGGEVFLKSHASSERLLTQFFFSDNY